MYMSIPIASAAVLVLAQLVPSSIVKTVVEAGSLGVLLAFLMLVHTRTLPNLLKAYREEMKEEREHFRVALDRVLAFRKEDSEGCSQVVGDLKSLVRQLDRKAGDGLE